MPSPAEPPRLAPNATGVRRGQMSCPIPAGDGSGTGTAPGTALKGREKGVPHLAQVSQRSCGCSIPGMFQPRLIPLRLCRAGAKRGNPQQNDLKPSESPEGPQRFNLSLFREWCSFPKSPHWRPQVCMEQSGAEIQKSLRSHFTVAKRNPWRVLPSVVCDLHTPSSVPVFFLLSCYFRHWLWIKCS